MGLNLDPTAQNSVAVVTAAVCDSILATIWSPRVSSDRWVIAPSIDAIFGLGKVLDERGWPQRNISMGITIAQYSPSVPQAAATFCGHCATVHEDVKSAGMLKIAEAFERWVHIGPRAAAWLKANAGRVKLPRSPTRELGCSG